MVDYTWGAKRTDTNADVTLKLSGGVISEVTVTPPPPPVLVPSDTDTVTKGSVSRKVDAVNPTATSNPAGAQYAGFRGTNQLVVYTTGSVTQTNQYGVEVAFDSTGKVTQVNDRLTSGSTTGTSIPAEGGVLSGHDDSSLAESSADWLKANIQVGDQLVFSKTGTSPGGGTGGTGGTSGAFFLGASGMGVGDGSLNAAMTNHPLHACGTWSDGDEADFSQLVSGGEYGDWDEIIDIAIGGINIGAGESWSAAKNGEYTARWQDRIDQLAADYGTTRSKSKLHIRPFHEFNGDWSDYVVRGGQEADFVAAFRIMADIIHNTIPGAKVVWSPNDGTSGSLGLNVTACFPGAGYADYVGPDSYNWAPHVSQASEFDSWMNRMDGQNPVGLEKWRQFAASKGVGLVIPETGNPTVDTGDGAGPGGAWFTALEAWCAANAGEGAGKVKYAIFFNIGGYETKFEFWNGSPIAANQSFWDAFKAAPDRSGGSTGGGTGGNTGGGGTTNPPPTSTGSCIAIYKMMWSSNGPALSSLPSQMTHVRLSFLQGDPPSPVGWGNEGQTSTINAAKALAAAGKKVIWSIGGGGGAYNTGNRTGIINAVKNLRNLMGGALHGLDWDLEGSSYSQADIVAISKQLVTDIPGFEISFAPNGGNIGAYLPIAVACQQQGCLTWFGQQFYDSNVSYDAAKGRISQAVSAGIPIEKYTVGMMSPMPGDNTANYWTNAKCLDYIRRFKADFPGLRGAYLWEAQRTNSSTDASPAVWAANMKSVLG